MAKRVRSIQLSFRVTPEEHEVVKNKMSELPEWQRKAYLRKMALEGSIVKMDVSELSELISLKRRDSNNLNQIAKRVNANGRIYDEDIREILECQKKQEEILQDIFRTLTDKTSEN
jgi:Bacterial mobilisation protein (MobC).